MLRLKSIEKEEEEEEEGTRPHSFRTSPPSPDSRRRVAFVAMFTTRAHVRRRPNITTTVSFLFLLLLLLSLFFVDFVFWKETLHSFLLRIIY